MTKPGWNDPEDPVADFIKRIWRLLKTSIVLMTLGFILLVISYLGLI